MCLWSQKRTQFQCPICLNVQREVFQPKLVIFRAKLSIDASVRTCLPRIQGCLNVFLANHPRPFQWTVILRQKGFPNPGIEPETFRFPCRCSNHWATRLGWLNKALLRHTTCTFIVLTPRVLCNGGNPGPCKWQLRVWHVVQLFVLGIIRTGIVLARAPWKGSQARCAQTVKAW